MTAWRELTPEQQAEASIKPCTTCGAEPWVQVLVDGRPSSGSRVCTSWCHKMRSLNERASRRVIALESFELWLGQVYA